MNRRESKGFVELEWVCPNCDGRNKGSKKTCENCGAPQPDNVKFQRAADEKIIADEKAVNAAKAGADIHCGFCGTRNPANATTCSQCGADLKEGKAREAGQLLQAAPSAPKVVKCTNCGKGFNSKTGRGNLRNITIFVVIISIIGLASGVLISLASHTHR